MTAPTHTIFSILFILSIGLLLGITVNPAIAFFAVLGALLPDSDTEKSFIGRLFPPLSAYLERKLGHRQATHSLLALALLSLVSAPLAIVHLYWWVALLSGYFSHLIIDTINKSGVPLFYPSSIRAVMPKPEKWRIQVGSKAEIIIFTITSILVFLLLPINRVGLFKSLHYIIKDTPSAVADYRSWADEYIVYANVEGTFNISQKPIVSQFEVLGIENKNSLVVYDAHADLIYTVGTDQNTTIYPKTIRCVKGESIDVATKRVHIENELLGNLIDHIPKNGQTFIKGAIKTTDAVILPRDPDIYETIRPGINEIELRYARKRDFESVEVSTIFALSGDLYLRTISPKTAGVAPITKLSNFQTNIFANAAMPKQRVYTTEIYIHNLRNMAEILVSEGQHIQVGDLIAKLYYDNETQLAIEEQSLKKMIEKLKAKTDDISQIFITEARHRLKEIQKEQEKHKIYSAFNARILLIRVHAVHGNSLTIIVKLLVNAPESKPAIPEKFAPEKRAQNEAIFCEFF